MLQAALEGAALDPSTIWRWGQADPVFQAQIDACQEQADRIRTAMIEDSSFARIVRGEATAAEVKFWLTNRAPDRWKDRQIRELVGKDGAALLPAALVRDILGDEDDSPPPHPKGP